MGRLATRPDGYTLDLDSTVFEHYGRQEGSLKGHNPAGRGGPAITRCSACWPKPTSLLHGWLRSGNCGAARGAVEFLKGALALWGQRQKIRLVRADSGFFEDNSLSFLEERCLPYIVVARLTKFTKRQAQRVEDCKPLDGTYAAGEFRLKLLAGSKSDALWRCAS